MWFLSVVGLSMSLLHRAALAAACRNAVSSVWAEQLRIASVTIPMRQCAGCREKAPRADLVRLVQDGKETVRVDAAKVLPGRGVNLHHGCLDRALRTRAIVRGLRLQSGISPEQILDWPDQIPAS